MTSDDIVPASGSRDGRKEALPLAPGTEFEPAKDRRPHMPEPPPVSLVAVEDVHLHARYRQRDQLDAFYLDLLGFAPESADEGRSNQAADFVCYRAENFVLRFVLSAGNFERATMRPTGVIVQSLPVLEARLREKEIEFTRHRSINPGRETLLLQDPAGNWLEIDQVRLV